MNRRGLLAVKMIFLIQKKNLSPQKIYLLQKNQKLNPLRKHFLTKSYNQTITDPENGISQQVTNLLSQGNHSLIKRDENLDNCNKHAYSTAFMLSLESKSFKKKLDVVAYEMFNLTFYNKQLEVARNVIDMYRPPRITNMYKQGKIDSKCLNSHSLHAYNERVNNSNFIKKRV